MKNYFLSSIVFCCLVCSCSSTSVVLAIPGDGNQDGIVDGLDFNVWADHYGDDPAQDPPGSPSNGDYNEDGKVDGKDYIIWSRFFGQTEPKPEYWVSTNGHDDNPGTKEQPFRTIQHASNISNPGDTVRIESGSYDGWSITNSGTKNDPIVFVGEGIHSTLIDGRNHNNEGLTGQNHSNITIKNMAFRYWEKEGIFFNNCLNIHLEDIEVQGCGWRRSKWDHGISIENTTNISMDYVHSFENYAMGVYIHNCNGGVLQWVVGNNNTGTDGSDGILLQNSRNFLLKDCHAWNNSEDGIDIGGHESTGTDSHTIMIEGCHAGSNDGEGFACSGTNGSEFRTYNVMLLNCQSTDNDGDGFQIYQKATEVTSIGSSFDRNRRGLNIHSGARDVLIENGSIQNNRVEPYSVDSDTTNVVIRNNQE